MKKLLFSCLVLLVCSVAVAQTKISPRLVNGYRAVYTEEQTIEAGGNETKTVSETEYVVSDVTPTGAVITCTLLNVETTGGDDDLTAKITHLSECIMEGVSVRLQTNADGQVTGILNFDEVKARGTAMATNLINALLAVNPDMEQMVPKDVLLNQITSGITEENLINGFGVGGVLALNGKTAMNGATENVVYQGMKMKRMYFVAGKNVITNATLDMSRDELKEFVINQVAQIAPDQKEMISQNIDMVLGQMTFQMNVKHTYEFQDNGWVKSVRTEMTQDVMGQSAKQTSITALKE